MSELTNNLQTRLDRILKKFVRFQKKKSKVNTDIRKLREHVYQKKDAKEIEIIRHTIDTKF